MVVRGCRSSNGGGHGRPGIRCGMHPQQTAAEGEENRPVDTLAPSSASLRASNAVYPLFRSRGNLSIWSNGEGGRPSK